MLHKCSIDMSRCFIEFFIDIHVVRNIVIPQMNCKECLYIITMVFKILSDEAKDVLKHMYP